VRVTLFGPDSSENTSHETNLSAQRAQAQTYPRLPGAHAHTRRPRNHQRPPRQGPTSPERLITLAAAAARFPKEARLLQSKEFQAVLRNPDKIASRDSRFTVFAVANGRPRPRIGIAVSRRVARTAVGRNRIKRQVRESFRAVQQDLGGLDLVVLAQPTASAATAQELRSSLHRHWHRVTARCKS
jgi:ribonuclease P protein component